MEPGTESHGERRHRRKRRSFWKSRQFWVPLLAVLLAILLALYLISRLGGYRTEVD